MERNIYKSITPVFCLAVEPEFAFDVQFTAREVYDHAQRRLHTTSTRLAKSEAAAAAARGTSTSESGDHPHLRPQFSTGSSPGRDQFMGPESSVASKEVGGSLLVNQ